jgi:hypothetical protein
MTFDERDAGKKLAAIAREDGCTIEQAFERAVNLYMTVQLAVWRNRHVLGVVNKDFEVVGVIASGPNVFDTPEPPDPNYEIDL